MKKLLSFLLITLLSISFLSAQGILDELKNGKTQDSLLRLKITGNGYSDETIILFMGPSTECFDSNYDAYKLFGLPAAPQLYNIIQDTCVNLEIKMAVNVLPCIYLGREIQLGIRVDDATQNTEVYEIEATEMSYPAGCQIYLEDTEDNVWVDLMTTPSYSFIHNSGNTTRFKVWYFPTVQASITADFEGAYESSLGEMRTELNSKNHLPLEPPFTVPGSCMGSQSVTSIPNADVVDWILVEFRDATSAANATASTSVNYQAAFLLKDGSIVQRDGVTPITALKYPDDNLYVVLHCRNHLDVISANGMTQIAGVYSYNFTTAANKALGSTQNNQGDGTFGLLGGDTNEDGTIDLNDATDYWINEVGTPGYLPSDVSYDGESNNQDKNDVWLQNTGISSSVPN
jgi:hypothetical protein